MRIVLVCPFDPAPRQVDGRSANVGGVERVYIEVARRLARHHTLDVVCSSDEEGVSHDQGITFRRVRRSMTLFRTPVADLAAHIPDCDVVMVPATYPLTTERVLRTAARRNIPAVLDFHFEPVPDGLAGRAAARAYARLGPRSYRSAKLVVVRSDSYARSAGSLHVVPRDRLRIIPNGLDPEHFRPVAGSKGTHLLFVGRLVPYKGLDVLLDAMARARLRRPLWIAGEGPLRLELQSKARRLGLPVHFLGRVRDEDLPGLYSGAALTVLPSVNRQEAFGIVLLESMACGTPVVASDLPGVSDVARLGGLVARTGDADDLAGTLARALDPGAVPAGAALAARIRSDFGWDAIAARFEEVLQEAAGLPTPRPVEVTVADPRRHALP